MSNVKDGTSPITDEIFIGYLSKLRRLIDCVWQSAYALGENSDANCRWYDYVLHDSRKLREELLALETRIESLRASASEEVEK